MDGLEPVLASLRERWNSDTWPCGDSRPEQSAEVPVRTLCLRRDPVTETDVQTEEHHHGDTVHVLQDTAGHVVKEVIIFTYYILYIIYYIHAMYHLIRSILLVLCTCSYVFKDGYKV